MARRARPGTHEHGPLENGFRARRCAAPRNDELFERELMGNIRLALGNALLAGPAALLLLLATGAAAQPMPECRQAKTEAEKAICGNPELSAADKRMAQAYAALRAQLPSEQKAALLADQRRWITRRGAACGDKSDDAL